MHIVDRGPEPDVMYATRQYSDKPLLEVSHDSPFAVKYRKDNLLPDIKPLVWQESFDCVEEAVTPFGTYFIVDDIDDFTGLFLEFVTHKDAKWWGDVKSSWEELADRELDEEGIQNLKAMAHTHYLALIASLFSGIKE